MWSSEPCEGLVICKAMAVPSFLSYFKTLSIVPAPEIGPVTSHSAVKHSTNTVRVNPSCHGNNGNTKKRLSLGVIMRGFFTCIEEEVMSLFISCYNGV